MPKGDAETPLPHSVSTWGEVAPCNTRISQYVFQTLCKIWKYNFWNLFCIYWFECVGNSITSPTVLSETKTEFGRESYDQNGETGKLAFQTEGCCFRARMTRDNAIVALSQGNVAGIVARVSR